MRRDVVQGVKAGSRMAMGCSALALIAALLVGPAEFADRVRMGVVGLILLYLVAGTLLGAVVGLLKPLAESTPGTMLIGLTCGLLLGEMMALSIPELDSETHKLMLLTVGGFASVGALEFRRRARRR